MIVTGVVVPQETTSLHLLAVLAGGPSEGKIARYGSKVFVISVAPCDMSRWGVGRYPPPSLITVTLDQGHQPPVVLAR